MNDSLIRKISVPDYFSDISNCSIFFNFGRLQILNSSKEHAHWLKLFMVHGNNFIYVNISIVDNLILNIVIIQHFLYFVSPKMPLGVKLSNK